MKDVVVTLLEEIKIHCLSSNHWTPILKQWIKKCQYLLLFIYFLRFFSFNNTNLFLTVFLGQKFRHGWAWSSAQSFIRIKLR